MDDNSVSETLSVRRKPSGILRIDVSKPRRLSGGSVEFKIQPELLGGDDKNGEPVSPASSASCYAIASPQLSVRWANQQDDTSECSHLDQLSDDQTSPLPASVPAPKLPPAPKVKRSSSTARRKFHQHPLFETSDEYFFRRDKEKFYMEPLSSPLDVPDLHSEEDDYSASVSAIIQRRASTRGSRRLSKKGRRTSSPLDSMLEKKDRRRSSVYTTSSGETAITMEENTNQDSTQEQIFENIRVHKEVLQQVKWQPWSMKRKLRLVQQAKNYIARHEGELHERFAASRNTKDIVARFKIMINAWFSQKWQHFKREVANFSTVLIPWELRIKEIESHFGSVVASYFTFLRWLFWVNIVIGVVLIVFLAVPELIATELSGISNGTDLRKKMSEPEEIVAGKLITIWDFEGVLKYSPLFYGFYAKHTHVGIMRWYNIPLAYFLVGVAVYIYSFYATLSKMAENSRMSKLSSKDDECTFSWKIFTGWDFMIGHAETAANRLSSVILGFKEALLEESEKKKDARNWKVICLRIFVNLVVVALLVVSAWAVIFVVEDSKTVTAKDSWWRRNEITLVLSVISFFFPMFFEGLGLIEYYHPRQQLRIQLARIMALNLLNLYSLIFALFDKIKGMSAESDQIRPIIESRLYSISNGYDPTALTTPMMDIGLICPNCSLSTIATMVTMLPTVLHTLTTRRRPKLSTTTEMSTTTEPPTTTEIVPLDYDKSVEHYYFISENETLGYDDFPERHARAIPNAEMLDYDDSNGTEWETTTMVDRNWTDFLVTTMIADTVTNFTEFSEEDILDYLTTKVQEATTEETYNYDEYYDDDLADYYTPPSTQVTEMTTMEMMTEPPPDMLVTALSTAPNITFEEAEQKIRTLCWETMFGQELVKLTVMDLVVTVVSTIMIDFFRALFVRYMNGCWCWDLEKQFPQYGDFKIAENILHLVNNQGMVWMGMFFSPGLAIINLVKLGIMMYLRSWAVLTCNVPHEVVFRASRSNNFYYALLLTMLFLCVLPVAYAIVLLSPSWHCGPFSDHDKIYYLFTNATMDLAPQFTHEFFGYLASPAAVIPLLVLLILIIYYLVSLTGSLREANHDLRSQLRKERTEERKKMWKLAEEQTKGPKNGSNVLSARWKKVIEGTQSPSPDKPGDTKVEARKELLARIMKRALRKESATSDEESQATDTEMHESLPHDQPEKKLKMKIRNPFAHIIALAKTQEAENKDNRENIRRESQGETDNERIVSERRRSILKRQENIVKHVDEKSQRKASDDPPLIFKFDESLPREEEPKKKGKKGRRARCSPHHESGDESDISKQHSPHYVVPKFLPEPPPEYEDPVKLTKFTPVPDDPIYAKVKKKKSTSLDSNDKDFQCISISESSEDHDCLVHTEAKVEKKKSKPLRPEPKEFPKKSPARRRKKHKAERSPIREEREKSLERLEESEAKPEKEAKREKEPKPESEVKNNNSRKKLHDFINRMKEVVHSKGHEDEVASAGEPSPPEESVHEQKPNKRQDSKSSIWSDNIPVIMISKTESAENILEENSTIKRKPKKEKKTKTESKPPPDEPEASPDA